MSEKLFDARLAFGGWDAPDAPVEFEVVFGGEALVESSEFQEGATARTDSVALGARVKPKDARLASGGFEQAEQQVNFGGGSYRRHWDPESRR